MKGIRLLRYDYNEPQKGKDQCDRKSDVAKRYINAYVNAGNKCMSAQDIKKGVLFFGGSKDSKVSVVKIDKLKSVIVSNITNIRSIHSISYNDNGMTLWQYFSCDKGKTDLFSVLEFVIGLTEIEPFEGGEIFRANRNQKKRKDVLTQVSTAVSRHVLCFSILKLTSKTIRMPTTPRTNIHQWIQFYYIMLICLFVQL